MKAWIERSLIVAGLLSLSACGGSGGGSVTSPPPPPPPPPPPTAPTIDVQRVFPNLDFVAPVSLVQAPGDANRWFVLEQAGRVLVFPNDQAATTQDVVVFVNISARVLSGGERGLLGIAFHPAYPTTPEVYLSYTATGSGASTVSRFELDNTGQALDPNSEQILFTIPQPAPNHNGGDLAFGPDGYLYASFGDGGGSGDPGENAQNTNNLLGTIVRIDIDVAGSYDIPLDNPFAGPNFCTQGFSNNNPCPEIYAWGLRNPWRMGFDSATGALWIGDVGQGAWEEVDRIDSSQAALDRNFGWDDREGAHCFEPMTGCLTNSLDPVAEYGRNLGQSITGGYVYRGSAVSDLSGWYVFGDFVAGRIFAVPADSQPTVAPEVLLESGLSISTFAESSGQEIFVVDYGGAIYRIVDAP